MFRWEFDCLCAFRDGFCPKNARLKNEDIDVGSEKKLETVEEAGVGVVGSEDFEGADDGELGTFCGDVEIAGFVDTGDSPGTAGSSPPPEPSTVSDPACSRSTGASAAAAAAGSSTAIAG